ncbi:MAG: hypothetical protein ACODAU_07790 [Myxococcota bacterium]
MRAWLLGPLTIAAIVPVGSGCASLHRSEVRGAVDESRGVHDVPVNGWQVEVKTTDGTEVEGELLAVDQGQIYLLLYPPHRLWSGARASVASVELELYDSKPGAALGWTLVGLATSISHGILALATAPAWLATGLASALMEWGAARASFGPERWHLLGQYARFPFGPPPGLLRHFEGPHTERAPLAP